MNLYRRANGIWYINYEHEGKRVQRSTGTKNKKQAFVFISQMSQEALLASSITLSDFIKKFLPYSENNKSAASTINDIRALTRLLEIIGNKPLNAINLLDIEKFKAERLGHVTKTTVNIDLRTCKAAFNVAIKMRCLGNNPFVGVKQLKEPRKKITYLSLDEIKLLLNSIKESWLYDVVLFALNTGFRRGEIVSLKWKDISLATREITISNTEEFTVKGGEGRTVPINNTVYKMLVDKQRTSEYVLTNASGEQLYAHYLTSRFKHYVLLSGLNPTLHFHHLRHTFATTLIQKGVPIYEVQKLLGHSRISTTEIYAHMNVDTLRASVAVLDSLMTGKRK